VKIEQCLDYSQDPDHPMNEVIFNVQYRYIVDPVYLSQHLSGAVPYWCTGSFQNSCFTDRKILDLDPASITVIQEPDPV
jgi:hypothetical protein